MKPWGYWTTLGWSVLAFLAGQSAGFGVLLWLRRGDLDSLWQTPYDGVFVTIFVVLSNPVSIAILVLAARLARADLYEFFALKWPSRRDLAFGIAALIALIVAGGALLFPFGPHLLLPLP